MRLGYTDIARYPGGAPGWTEAGYHLETAEAWAVNERLAAGAVCVDLRDPAAFSAGHLPGARNVPAADLLADPAGSLPDIDPDTEIVLYGPGGPSPEDTSAAFTLEAAGFRRVVLYTAGFEGWSAAGAPVE